jgi:hypothetical protein
MAYLRLVFGKDGGNELIMVVADWFTLKLSAQVPSCIRYLKWHL